jgi:hypothetical protein
VGYVGGSFNKQGSQGLSLSESLFFTDSMIQAEHFADANFSKSVDV